MTTDLIAQAEAALDGLADYRCNGGAADTLRLRKEAAAVIPALIARIRELEGANTQFWEANIRLQRERDTFRDMLAKRSGDDVVMHYKMKARAEAAEATVATLTAQVEAMRGALEPFIGLAKYRVADDPKWRDHDTVQVVITIGALRAALTTENQTNG